MINMDQVRTLEVKVKQTVQLIVHLRRENDSLRGRLSDTEVRLQELEALLESFKATQNEMESGIRSALQELDHLDQGSPEPTPPPVAEAHPEPVSIETESEPVPEPEPEVASFEPIEAFEAPVPESVELSESDDATAEVPAEESPVEDEAEEEEPQQPGLGIF